LLEVLADLGVALAESGDLAGEALDGPAGADGAADLVDVGEIARARHRDAQGVGRRLAAAQLGVGETAVGALDRLAVILGERPAHGRCSCGGAGEVERGSRSYRRGAGRSCQGRLPPNRPRET